MQNLILECALRALLTAVCVGAVLCVLRVKAARVRHAVWAGVVVSMLALPVWTAWGPRAAARVLHPVAAPAMYHAAISTDSFYAPGASPTVGGTEWTRPRLTWQNCLAGIYLLGLCALLARLAIGTVRAQMLVRRAVKCEGRPASDLCAAPVTVGWLHPAVILPEDWRRWPRAQLSAVLAHEGEHARWRDPLVQWLALLNRAIFWFHPLAWWLERRLSGLAEEACDAAVLARGHDRFEYSEYLLAMARAMQQTSARVNIMGMAMAGPFLPQRIRRILEGGPAQRLSRVRLACVAVSCVLVSTVFTAGAMDHAPAQEIAAPVLAPVVNPVASQAVAAHSSEAPMPPHKRPRVLLAQAQRTPARPNPSPANSNSQEAGSILGSVEDPSGARVPGCLITVSDPSGASVGTARSDAAGLYRLASIPPGQYTVEYLMRGFARRRVETSVEAGKAARVDATLEIGLVFSTVDVVGQKPASPAPATAQPAPQPSPVSVGGRVENARLLRQRQPVYPPELLQQGVEGTVRIRTTISRDGAPVNPHVLNSDEIDSRFAEAALTAVRQWRYQPTKLNGDPVETETTIDVTFELQQ
jgi:TonB family protein